MNEIKEMINNAFDQKMQDGSIEKIVNDAIDKMIADAAKDALGWSSKAQKLMKDKLEDVMIKVIKQSDFDTYVNAFTILVNGILEDTSLKRYHDFAEQIKRTIDANKYDPVKEIKISEMFDHFCKVISKYGIDSDDTFASNDGEGAYVICKCDVSDDRGRTKIDFYVDKYDADDYSSIFDCKYSFTTYIFKNKYGYINLGSTAFEDFRRADEFMQYLMALTANYCHVIIDDEYGFEETVSLSV